MGNHCYYDNDDCDYGDGLWECETCHEKFCHAHWHESDQGINVECAACEYERLERYKEYWDNRDLLRDKLVRTQDDLCVICGHGMYGDSQIHEAIVKRGDLPNDPIIFSIFNCVVLHASCHENTRDVDVACADYLIYEHGLEVIYNWIRSLDMMILPGRAAEIVNRYLSTLKPGTAMGE